MGKRREKSQGSRSIDQELVIIANREFIRKQGKYYVEGSFELQLIALAKSFKRATIYMFPARQGFATQELRLPKSIAIGDMKTLACEGIGEFFRYRSTYEERFADIVQKHPNAIYHVLFPGSLIGVAAVRFLKRQGKRVTVRVMSDVANDFRIRDNKAWRRVLHFFFGGLVNAYMKSTLRGLLCFYSGYVIYPGLAGGHYEILSTNTNRSIIQKRKSVKLHKKVQLLFVGRMDGTKGIEYLLEAATILRDEGLDFHLNMVGGWFEYDRYRTMATEMDLDTHVTFHGNIPFGKRLFSFYQKSDIFVMPSLQDVIGKVNIEAMSFGCPVITTTAGGIPRFVKHEQNGLLVKPASTRELVAAIKRLISDEQLRKRLVTHGYATARRLSLDEQIAFMVKKIGEQYG